jgi:hypothetical protein
VGFVGGAPQAALTRQTSSIEARQRFMLPCYMVADAAIIVSALHGTAEHFSLPA